jgi:hypothetical protein
VPKPKDDGIGQLIVPALITSNKKVSYHCVLDFCLFMIGDRVNLCAIYSEVYNHKSVN